MDRTGELILEAVDFENNVIIVSDGSCFPILRMIDMEGETTLEKEEAYELQVMMGDGVCIFFSVYTMDEDTLPESVH